jgi:hypothetical protein
MTAPLSTLVNSAGRFWSAIQARPASVTFLSPEIFAWTCTVSPPEIRPGVSVVARRVSLPSTVRL